MFVWFEPNRRGVSYVSLGSVESLSPHLATKLCRDCSLHNADSKASDKQMYTPYFVSLVNLYLRFFIINLFPDMILTSTKMNQD